MAAAERCSLLLTSAWNPVVPGPAGALMERRKRLRESIAYYAHLEIARRIVLADATLTEVNRASLRAEFPYLEVPPLHTSPQGEHVGPSYLESLVYGAVVEAGVVKPDAERWIKVTGGYRVTNLRAILSVAQASDAAGLGFLHQHPLRPRPRFAMSAFYVLDGALLDRFLRFAADGAERARTEPLEGLLCEFLMTRNRRRIRSPYPRVDAFYATAQLRSDSRRLLLNTLSWGMLSRLGLYAWCLPRAAPAQAAAAS
jgi:hypothetical protein